MIHSNKVKLRYKNIHIRLTEEEFNLISAQANKFNTTKTKLIVNSVSKTQSLLPFANKEEISELRRIGININQIARILNTNSRTLSLPEISKNINNTLENLNFLLSKIHGNL